MSASGRLQCFTALRRLWVKSGGEDVRGPMSGPLLTADVANA